MSNENVLLCRNSESLKHREDKRKVSNFTFILICVVSACCAAIGAIICFKFGAIDGDIEMVLRLYA